MHIFPLQIELYLYDPDNQHNLYGLFLFDRQFHCCLKDLEEDQVTS